MKLYTSDLVLRTVKKNDIDEVARMWDFEKGTITMEEARKAIAYMQSNHKKNTPGSIYHLCLAVSERNQHKIIGWCGLDGKSAGKLHIFYLIDANYRNKGYAAQCATRLLAYAFDEANVSFVNGGCDKNNIASYKVMQKIGMRQNAFEDDGNPLFFISNIDWSEMKNA